MTDDEVQDFFREYVDGFMFSDIDAAIQAKANFGAALMLLNYTEILGSLFSGELGRKGVASASFETGLGLMQWNGDGSYYGAFQVRLTSGGASARVAGPYEVFRCGLAHEYFVKGLATVVNDPASSRRAASTIPGFGWDAARLCFHTNAYFRDLRGAFDKLRALIGSDIATRSNFEMAVQRVMGQSIAPHP